MSLQLQAHPDYKKFNAQFPFQPVEDGNYCRAGLVCINDIPGSASPKHLAALPQHDEAGDVDSADQWRQSLECMFNRFV